MFCLTAVLLVFGILNCIAKEFGDTLDQNIISCHSTDFRCFKRQYKGLRDLIVPGEQTLSVGYKPYVLKYGDTGTCVEMTGVEDSWLSAISFDGWNKSMTLTVELPFILHQVNSDPGNCIDNSYGFSFAILSTNESLRNFTGNASIQVEYPFELRKKRGEVFMRMGKEELDIFIDVPEFSQLGDDVSLFETSEWAYDVIQQVDAAQHFALPFSAALKKAIAKIPLRRLLLLYPEEDYTNITFSYKNNYNKENFNTLY